MASDLSTQGTLISSYGLALKSIQESDLAKCEAERLSPKAAPAPMCIRRLLNEIKTFITDHPLYVSWAPIDGDLCQVLGSIEGPPGSPYENGIFFIRMDFPEDYPRKPPTCTFLTKIYHPNIDSVGKICLNNLEKEWCAVWNTTNILLSICAILSKPVVDNALGTEIAAEYLNDRTAFESNAKAFTQIYATSTRSSQEEIEMASAFTQISLTSEQNDILEAIIDEEDWVFV